MSIWLKQKEGEQMRLAPYSYKRSLIYADGAGGERVIVYLEGVDMKLSTKPTAYGSCGGAINTNAGVSLTKEQLLEIVNALPDGGRMIVASCNKLVLSDRDKYGDSTRKTVHQEFEESNDMVQVGPSCFCPSNNLDAYYKEHPDAINWKL